MTTRYINVKTDCGTETVDEINSEDYATTSKFLKATRELLKEYRLAFSGLNVWASQRSTNDWKNR